MIFQQKREMNVNISNDFYYRVPTVREKSGKNQKSSRSGKSQTIFFSDDNYKSKSINSNDFQLLGELCYS